MLFIFFIPRPRSSKTQSVTHLFYFINHRVTKARKVNKKRTNIILHNFSWLLSCKVIFTWKSGKNRPSVSLYKKGGIFWRDIIHLEDLYCEWCLLDQGRAGPWKCHTRAATAVQQLIQSAFYVKVVPLCVIWSVKDWVRKTLSLCAIQPMVTGAKIVYNQAPLGLAHSTSVLG